MRRFSRCILAVWVMCAASAQAADVKEIKTPGGITAWLVEEHSQPIVAAKIAFRDSGIAYDPAGKEGRASMTAALLLEGAGELDAKAFNNALDAKAIHLHIGVDEDVFMASLETLSENKDAAFAHLGMALAQPRFDEGAIARVKDQTKTTLAQQELSPAYRLHRGWERIAYGNHPYGKPALGTLASIDALQREDFQALAQRYLTRGNIVVSVVGDISEAELAPLLDRTFAALPANYAPDSKVEDVALPVAQKEFIAQDIPQTMVMFGTNGIKRSDKDYFTAYVMNYLLGGGALTTRLGMEIREKRGLAYSISSDLAPMQHAASWQGLFSTRTEKADEAVQVMKDTLRQFLADGPSDTELADAKQYLTGSFVLKLDSNGEMANFLASLQLHRLGIDYMQTRNARIEAVRKEDVLAMARRLIDPDKLLVVMVGNPTKVDNKP